MRGARERRRAPRLLVLGGIAAALLVPASGGADPSPSVATLRQEQASLTARSHATLLSLYSLDTRLAQARTALAQFQNQAVALRAEQLRTQHEQTIARRAWQKSVTALGNQLRALYEQGQPDAISILLSATSVNDAMTQLDQLERTARLNRLTIGQARAAQRTLHRVSVELAARAERVRQLEAQASQTTAALTQTRAQRVAYIASLANQRTLNSREIARLQASAQQIAARSQTITAVATPVASSSPDVATTTPAPTVGSRQLTVSATGYSLSGRTATGMPVGWGVVAVDPSVIPLGTRMSIPGYGEGVAADTGGAVHGATIDLWFATTAQALAWGRRTVTITLH